MTRAAILAAEAGARQYRHGGWFCASEPFTALRALMPSWMTRVNEIFKTLGSHNLLCTPNEAAFQNPELGPLLRRYLPGANDISAEERARIFAGNHLIAQAGREWTDVADFRRISGIE